MDIHIFTISNQFPTSYNLIYHPYTHGPQITNTLMMMMLTNNMNMNMNMQCGACDLTCEGGKLNVCKQSKSRFCSYSCQSDSFEAMKEYCPPPREVDSQWLAGAGAKFVQPKETCTICLDTPQPGLAIVTHCNHHFCAPCYKDWADAQCASGTFSCPNCREPATSIPR